MKSQFSLSSLTGLLFFGIALFNNIALAEYIEFDANVNAVAFTSDGSRAFVTTEGNYLYEVEVSSREIVQAIEIGGRTYGVVVDPTDNYVYAGTNSELVKVDLSDYRVESVMNSPAGIIWDILISPNHEQLWYITHTGNDRCVVVRLSDDSVVANFGVGGYPSEMAFRPDGSEMWTMGWTNKTVDSYSTANFQRTIRTEYNPNNPVSICFSPDGEFYYVVAGYHCYAERKRVSDNGRVGIWFTPQWTSAVWADSEKVYVSSTNGNIYKDDVVSEGNNEVLQIGGAPKNFEKNPGADELWIAGGHATNSVYILPTKSPEIAVSPQSLDFGEVEYGTTGSIALQISNSGDGALTVTSITSDNGAFTTDFGASFTIACGESHDVNISFAPDQAQSYSGTLTINSNDADESIITIDLSGTGLAPDIAVNPSSYDFGSLLVGRSATTSLSISNEGDANVTISAITASGAGFGVQFPGAFTIAPGANRNVAVTFAPLQTGAVAGSLRIESNDPDESITEITLTGRGTAPNIVLSTWIFAFPTTQVETVEKLSTHHSNESWNPAVKHKLDSSFRWSDEIRVIICTLETFSTVSS